MNEIVEKVRVFAQENELFAPGQRLCAAVSGGADSMALLRLLLRQYWALDSPSILYLICWCCGKCLVPFFNRDGTVCKNSPDSLNLIFARFFCSSFIYSLLRMHNLDVPTPVSFEIVQSELRQGLNTGAKCL